MNFTETTKGEGRIPDENEAAPIQGHETETSLEDNKAILSKKENENEGLTHSSDEDSEAIQPKMMDKNQATPQTQNDEEIISTTGLNEVSLPAKNEVAQSEIQLSTPQEKNSPIQPKKPDPLPSPPDGGWGWMVVLGSALFHLFYFGQAYSTGVLYLGFRSAFPEATSAEIASIMSTVMSVMFLLSPASAALLRRGFSARQLMVAGGVCAAAGYVVAAFATSVSGLRIPMNIFLGLAGVLCFLPSLSLVGQYFERRRSLATGLAIVGAGLGDFVMPPLITLALEEYGIFGTMLLIAASQLHVSLGGILHRPLERPRRKEGSMPSSTVPKKAFSFSLFRHSLVRLPLHLFRSPLLRPPILLHLLAHVLETPAVWIAVSFLPALAREHGVEEVAASSLASISNGGSAVGRIFVGFAMDLEWLRHHRVATAGAVIFLGAVADVGVLFVASYSAFAAFSICRGLLDGASFILRLLVLQDLVGREGYTDALGFLFVSIGVGVLALPTLAGVVVDGFGVVEAAFVLAAGSHFVAGILTAAIWWQRKKSEMLRNEEKDKTEKKY